MRGSARGAYVQWLCVELGMRVCDFCVCVCVARGGGVFLQLLHPLTAM